MDTCGNMDDSTECESNNTTCTRPRHPTSVASSAGDCTGGEEHVISTEDPASEGNSGLRLFDSSHLNHTSSKENTNDDISESISEITKMSKDAEITQENDNNQEIKTPQNVNLNSISRELDLDDFLEAKDNLVNIDRPSTSNESANINIEDQITTSHKHTLGLVPGVDGSQATPETRPNKERMLIADSSGNSGLSNKMPFGLLSASNNTEVSTSCAETKNDDEETQSNDSDEEEKSNNKGERIIDLGGIEIPEMLSPKSRIDYINDMRKQLGNLITKGPSIVATNLLHGVSEPPIGSPKDKILTDIDTWEVLTPYSSSSMADLINPSGQTLHGTLTREGEMISFVADDIMEKIRQSASPMASSRGSPASSVTASAPDTPLLPSRAESFSKTAIPPIDPTVITDIEKHCVKVADSLDLMLGNLTGSIHNMSAITVGHIQTYKHAADKVGFTVDQSVKAMYSLMAKCEQLNKMMEPVQDLAQQIKGIKRLLDELESKCK